MQGKIVPSIQSCLISTRWKVNCITFLFLCHCQLLAYFVFYDAGHTQSIKECHASSFKEDLCPLFLQNLCLKLLWYVHIDHILLGGSFSLLFILILTYILFPSPQNGEGAWFHCFFYIPANAYSKFVFKKDMEKIKDKDIFAFHWLRNNETLEH